MHLEVEGVNFIKESYSVKARSYQQMGKRYSYLMPYFDEEN